MFSHWTEYSYCYIEKKLYFFRLIEHESCEKLYREIEGLLNVRELEHKSSEKYVLYSSQVRLRLKQFTDEVQQLSHKLRGLATSKAVYPLL
jgi:hypothetical protein